MAPPPDPEEITSTLQTVENCLLGVFNYYAQISNERTPDGRKPVRVLNSSKFQRFAVDADLVSPEGDSRPNELGVITHAMVDLIYKQAAGRKTGKDGRMLLDRGSRMNFDQFMDAAVLLALAKFPHHEQSEMKEFSALKDLHDKYLQTFNGDVNDPLEHIIDELNEEWYHLATQVAPVLYDIYLRYFKIEVNPHFQQAGSTAHAQALKSFMDLMDDFSVARQVGDIRPLIYTAVRDAEHTAIPETLQTRLNVLERGKYFTFHHFILALQKIADAQQRDGGAAEKLARLLHVMEQARAPHGRVRFLPPGTVSEENHVIEPKEGPDLEEVRKGMRAVFNWYVSLGEPLKRELSTRKFTRFLRDAGLLSPDSSGSMSMSMSRSGVGALGVGGRRNNAGFSFSPTKAQVEAAQNGRDPEPDDQVYGKNALPVRPAQDATTRQNTFDHPPLLQVDVDLIFIKARHPKNYYSVSALPGFDYRDRGEHGPGYYKEIPGTSTNMRKTPEKAGARSHGSGSHLDYPAFEGACEEIARRIWPGIELSQAMTEFNEQICEKLVGSESKGTEGLLADLDQLLALVPDTANGTGLGLQQSEIKIEPGTYELIEDEPGATGCKPGTKSKVREGIHAIFRGYLQQRHRGMKIGGERLKDLMVIDDFSDFCSEFRIVDKIKPLILNRIFYKNAHYNIALTQSVAAMDEDGFIVSLVFIAEKMEQTRVLPRQQDRVLALLHHINQLTFCSRLAHLRPVFILEDIPEIVVAERRPQVWKNMLRQLEADPTIGAQLSVSQYGSKAPGTPARGGRSAR
jgi:hypothetical protein